MKKFVFLVGLFSMFVIAGCGSNKKVDIVDNDSLNSYDLDICDKYFSIFNCVIENEVNDDWPEERREELKKDVVNLQESRATLDIQEIENNCKTYYDGLYEIKDRLDEIGCSIE